MNFLAGKKLRSPFVQLSLVHLLLAVMFMLYMLVRYGRVSSFQYLILAFLAFLFIVIQALALRRPKTPREKAITTWTVICSYSLCVVIGMTFIQNALLPSLVLLTLLPLFVAVTQQLKLLPPILFLTFVYAAVLILIDIVPPLPLWRLKVDRHQFWLISGIGMVCYISGIALLFYFRFRYQHHTLRFQINVATQYALVMTGISAMVIVLITGVMIFQIRKTQLNQVGNTFQTIAENVAKLVGSHLEQQTQKLQLLTEQVPIFKKVLTSVNAQYTDRKMAHKLLAKNNQLWQQPQRNEAFVMSYLSNPVNRALSRFRGHNSFHNHLLLVDHYGGLVAALGYTPKHFYFYDQKWFTYSWNGGLGNIFIGDITFDQHAPAPKLRIAVDIMDRSTNEIIGILSSTYLLRTLMEDIQRFKPKAVDQISLIDAQGRVIVSTIEKLVHHQVWPHLNAVSGNTETADSGWLLGHDHLNQSALIGYSALSTDYNVISDPLYRLQWHVVVSGTQSNTLAQVTRSTKLAMLVGLLAMAFGVLVAIAAARVITRPIENLTATASAMLEGDLNTLAQLAGPTELVALSTGFNRLTERLNRVIRDLKDQTVQLAEAKQEAEAATKLKSEFLAKMSHEIRTPLNAILGFADILDSSLEDVKQKRNLQIIKTSGSDLLHLINDILDLSKIEAGQMDLQTGPVSLRALFDELQRIFSISAAGKNIRLEVMVDTNVPSQLILDRVRIRQVLFNLVGNAIKFTPQGGVYCLARAAPRSPDHLWDLTLEVQDTGIGIAPDAFETIFESFKQHRPESHGAIKGTGLGLAITKNLVEIMGGRIELSSQIGQGTLFRIDLPHIQTPDDLEVSSAFDHLELAPSTDIWFKPASILIADDLEVNRRHIMEALKASPLTLVEAENGRVAVDLATQKQFDLILMDLQMPEMDGYTALKRIRARSSLMKVPIIAITAAGMKEDITMIQQAGFNNYLIRPFDQNALYVILETYLPHEDRRNAVDPAPFNPPMSVSDFQVAEDWICPPEVAVYLLTTFKQRWEEAKHKQSIPDIIEFAVNIKLMGDRYHVDLLSRYGAELREYAEAFDVQNVEILLNLYETILNCRIGEETVR